MAYLNRKTFQIIKYGDRRIERLWAENFHVDDLIAPTIQILNRRGYFTAGCCAGEHSIPADGVWDYQHVFGTCWILFKEGVSLPSLPPGFHIEPYEILPSSVCIAKICDTQHEKAMNQLYEWALNLPEFTGNI